MSFDKREPLADETNQSTPDALSFDAKQNLVGFFALLLEIDRRTSSKHSL
jgi:hypothetical protein